MQEELALEQKKEIKKDMNSLGKAIMLYTVSLFGVFIVISIGVSISIAMKYSNNEKLVEKMTEEVVNNIANNGWSYILSVVVGLIFIYIYRKNKLFTEDLTETNKKMDLKTFITMFVILMAPQFIAVILQVLLESGLNSIGFSIMGQIEEATSGSQTFSMFLYVAFVGPIIEEVVFRGAVLGSLKKYGKGFAIIISAVLFGIMHANLIQSIFAIIIGLVLGYVRTEYSIKWAILLHIINNLISEVMSYMSYGGNDFLETLISGGLSAFIFVLSLLILNSKKEELKNYIKINKPVKKSCSYALTRFWILAFILLNTLIAIGGIEKI